jgi:hypothetical protein
VDGPGDEEPRAAWVGNRRGEAAAWLCKPLVVVALLVVALLARALAPATCPSGPGSLRAPPTFPPATGRGTSPWVTEAGTDERPMRCPARRLTDQVRVTVTTMPSTAPRAHMTPRRVIFMAAGP